MIHCGAPHPAIQLIDRRKRALLKNHRRRARAAYFIPAHTDPRVTGDPVLKTLLGQAPNWQVGQPTPKWVAAENLTRPVIESIYTGQKPAKAAMEDLARQISALPD